MFACADAVYVCRESHLGMIPWVLSRVAIVRNFMFTEHLSNAVCFLYVCVCVYMCVYVCVCVCEGNCIGMCLCACIYLPVCVTESILKGIDISASKRCFVCRLSLS